MFANGEVQNDNTVKHGDDSNLLVRFYFNKVFETHYIKINVPGDNKTEWDRAVREDDKLRFPMQWQAYQAQVDQFGEETMIDNADFLSEAEIENLKKHNIHTVKQLAGLTDGLMGNVGMGTRDLVRKAQAYLDSQGRKAVEEKLLAEINQRDDEIAQLKGELVDLKEEVANMIAASSKSPAKRKAKKSN